ncbi:M23 family peptidase [Pseudorhodobacter sp. E13]|uniref:M23 family metallopeptidase n=1 Tax=Pseudorhodobacter sp. E13 TaxID=2487931 RepID=UPI000F8D97AE|nr:M23 family metallopeptidase [Pseudorhodobacter sp. E13]RUS59105.1 M23 family peptidase [Pseudorhodobacter sp. E13]
MLKRLSYRINGVVGRYFPEQRLFLKSDTETRFIRLQPMTQAIALTGSALFLGWTILATSILMMESISAGSGREQAQRQQALYEARLNALSADRDLRAEEAARAQERFNLALKEVSEMQARLLASEDGRREMETGVDVIQSTLRRTIKERDEARAEKEALTASLQEQSGGSTLEGRARDAATTVEILAGALAGTAEQRDSMAVVAMAAKEQTDAIAAQKRALETKNDVIFAKLEEAVTISMAPLDKMFRSAGMSPDDLLKAVRRGYSGQGGPLTPFSLSTKGESLSNDEIRANAILQGLDRMNMYRLAAAKSPFAMPVKSAFRFTSGFGYRRDPKGAGTRMHNGTDFAASTGTPIYSTADGVVTYAGWNSGYGRHVKVQHEFGIETSYSHMSNIRVKVGQRVSRGDRIGDMGSSGRSTGTHLHYEVRIGGKPVNPMTFIKAATDVF